MPFQWVDIESVLAAALLLIALNVLASSRVGAPLLADTAAAVLAPVYLGLSRGCLVGVHAIVGREGVILLIATVAISDTAQYYTGRAFFFFSSRRRHTRLTCDWSSDVCSSD